MTRSKRDHSRWPSLSILLLCSTAACGGRDAGGTGSNPSTMQGDEGKVCNYADSKRTYHAKDPAQCALMGVPDCGDGQPFSDDCGCGCENL